MRLDGPRERWEALVTVREAAAEQRHGDQIAVAVDVGWRALPDGSMRVAYWRGEDGEHGALELSSYDLAGLTKSDGLRSQRDKNLEAMRAWLCDQLRDWLGERPELPEWLRRDTVRRGEQTPSSAQAIAYIAQWRSQARFAALQRRWQRFDGDDAIYAGLSWWRYRDHHLWEYEAGQRRGSQAHRLDIYRCFAHRLAERYGHVVIEKFDKRSTRTTKATEDGAQTENVELHHAQNLAAPSILIGALANAYGGVFDAQKRPLGRAYAVKCERTTIECGEADCDGVLYGDPADDIMQRCTRGHVWDQDENACKNLLRRFCERSRDDKTAGGARGDKPVKPEARYERSRRKRAERDARQEAARKADGNGAE
ncbi:MAG: hypothetical protein AAB875_02770 [Patescibacteria group bacterium]